MNPPAGSSSPTGLAASDSFLVRPCLAATGASYTGFVILLDCYQVVALVTRERDTTSQDHVDNAEVHLGIGFDRGARVYCRGHLVRTDPPPAVAGARKRHCPPARHHARPQVVRSQRVGSRFRRRRTTLDTQRFWGSATGISREFSGKTLAGSLPDRRGTSRLGGPLPPDLARPSALARRRCRRQCGSSGYLPALLVSRACPNCGQGK